MRRIPVVLAAILLCTLPIAADEPGQARGFDADKVFDFQSGIDKVNTFQGNLSLQLPIGPSYRVGGDLSYALSLSYNAKVWDYESHPDGMRALASRRSNAGMGWMLSLGRLIVPSSGLSNLDNSIYETPDGGDHNFWPTLHQGDPVTPWGGDIKSVAYTRDGSYLRLITRDVNHDNTIDSVEVESPDGLVRRFNPLNGNLLSIRDRHNNEITITYPSTLAGTPCPSSDRFAWIISDNSLARTTYVCFNNLTVHDSEYAGQIERVVIAAPPDAAGIPRTSTYQFFYSQEDIQRGCHWTYQPEGGTVFDVPMLSAIVQNPNTTESRAWTFAYNLNSTLHCETGTLKSYTMPTGATVSYVYRNWLIPVEECNTSTPWLKNYPGIASRSIEGPNIPPATWTYTSLAVRGPERTTCAEDSQPIQQLTPPEQMITTVTDPLGNVTEHYYSTWPMSAEPLFDPNGNPLPSTGNSPHGFRKREYGLPFTRKPGTSSGDRLLSRRVYTEQGYFANPKTPVRSYYVTYDTDNTICTVLDEFCTDSNARVTAERVVYHDDGDRVADTASSAFDGLGHFRQTDTSGTFEGNNVRTTYTAFNERHNEVNPGLGIASGTYPGSFTMPTLAQPWVLNTASFMRVTEGSSTATTQTCYDPSNGFLKATRVLKSANRGATDLLITTGRDASGNVISEAFAGGDVSANAPTSSSLCAAAPPPPDYAIQHTYDAGVRLTSKHAAASFFFFDQTVDRASGTVTSSRDTAGVSTGYEYDRSFRLKAVRPASMAATTYDYFNASGSTPERVEERTISSTAGTVESHYLYDALGRLWRRKVRMPNNTWSYSEQARNGRGWPEWSSELQNLPTPEPATPNFKTFYSSYDPFGRASSVVTPDSRVTFTQYKGVSSLIRRVQIAGVTTETQVKSREVYDRHGRLQSVTEAYETPDAVTTTYGYDVGNRLSSVSMPGDNAPQTRTFTYDNRGFLQSEQQPELGTSGYGLTSYSNYDARGHARRRVTGPLNGAFDVTYLYDSAERMLGTRQSSSGNDISIFVYDTGTQCAGNACKGKLTAAARFNRFSDLGRVAVVEHYQYNGPGARMSQRDVAVGSDDGVFQGADFYDYQFYDDLGHVSTVGYPCRLVNGNCTAAQRTVQNGYSNGRLSSVASFAPEISYHPNGAIATVTHANNVKDTATADPHGLFRPCSLLTYIGTLQTSTADCGFTIPSGSPVQWSSGPYNYDGVGNVKRIGDTKYAYDPFNRLNSWRRNSPDGSTYSESIGIDDHGNFLYSTMEACSAPINGQSQCATNDVFSPPLQGTTNHYADFTYDAAGNLIHDGDRQFLYDAFNRTATSVSMDRQFRYVYGPSEERIAIVERVSAGRSVRNRTTWTLRGFNGALLSSWLDDSTSGQRVWTWREDEIWRANVLLASVSATRTHHYSVDHLGSPRVVTNAAGQLVGTQQFGPFGAGGTSDGGFLQFTAQERDTAIVEGVVNLPDSFRARQYDKSGRFLSIDPTWESAYPELPQSWNRYTYVMNNPMRFTDPTGRVIDCPTITTGGRIDCTESIEVTAFDPAVTPYQVGWEWLTGTGPRHRVFVDGDWMTENLKKHGHIEWVVEETCAGKTLTASELRYKLDGWTGPFKYLWDASVVMSYGLTGNLTATYLGSYAVAPPTLVPAVAEITVTNSSTLASATRPPVLGYSSWWRNSVAPRINSAIATGPMSQTTQEFNFTVLCP